MKTRHPSAAPTRLRPAVTCLLVAASTLAVGVSAADPPPRPRAVSIGSVHDAGTSPLSAFRATLALTPVSARVTRTVQLVTTAVIQLRTKAGVIVTTPDHPFSLVGRGWVQARELAVGDFIVTAGAGRTSRILSLEATDVAPTPVYNFTVDKVHAYFVGPDALLVHNGNGCFRQRSQEGFDPDTGLYHSGWAANSGGRPLDPSHLLPPTPAGERRPINDVTLRREKNCSFCSLAALGGEPLSSFLGSHHISEREYRTRKMYDEDIRRRMRETGLADEHTTPVRNFAVPESEHTDYRARHYNLQAIMDFLRTSRENTFIVAYDRDDSGHAVTAIRTSSGTILFVDFQQTPPHYSDHLESDFSDMTVFPSNSDWTKNPYFTDRTGWQRQTFMN